MHTQIFSVRSLSDQANQPLLTVII